MIKCNTTASVHVGLRAVLARCPLQPLSSGEEEEDKDENKNKNKDKNNKKKGEA